jgi:hypothetical protein
VAIAINEKNQKASIRRSNLARTGRKKNNDQEKKQKENTI